MRKTKQKIEIMNFLASTKTHPRAEDVFEVVKKKLPDISLATIYRNLDSFVEQGQAICLNEKVKRFDANTSIHNHFICEKCGMIYDIYQDFNTKNKIKNKKNISKINSENITFYGICKKCKS